MSFLNGTGESIRDVELEVTNGTLYINAAEHAAGSAEGVSISTDFPCSVSATGDSQLVTINTSCVESKLVVQGMGPIGETPFTITFAY